MNTKNITRSTNSATKNIELYKEIIKGLESEIKSLKKNIASKDVLLSEIHHRVKNNLQIISSLLSLHALKSENEQVRAIMKDSQERIKTIALVHESLYHSNDFQTIDFQIYIKKLIQNISKSLGISYRNIEIDIKVSKVYLDISQSIPCGLILNEIITNSFKHAFVNTENGKITISFKLIGDKYKLTVADNGVGLPKNLDFENNESMGLHLVSILTKQLMGDIKIDNRKGTKFTIVFPKIN